MIVSPIESLTMESLSEAQRVANTRAMVGLLETAPLDDVEQLVPVSDMRLKVGAAGNTALHAAIKMDRSDCIGVFAPLSDLSARI